MGLPIVGDIIDAVKDVVLEIIPDKDKKREIALELEKIKDEGDKRLSTEMLAQAEINKVEAGHRSIFVAGWRPFIGWVGGFGLAWTFLIAPFLEFVARLLGWSGQMPQIDASLLMTLVLSLLGVGAFRSYDKAKGTSNDVLKAPVKVDMPKEPISILPEDAPWTK